MPTTKLTIQGTIQSAFPNANLEKLTIELRDQNQKISGIIARTETNEQGDFTFELNPYTIKRQFQGRTPEVFLVLTKHNRTLLSTLDEIVLELTKDITDLKIPLPKEIAKALVPEKKELPQLKVDNLLRIAGVKDQTMPEVMAKLKRAGLSDLKSLLSKPDRLTTGRTGLDENTLRRFKAVVRLGAAANSESVSQKLVDKGFHSFTDLGAVSYEALVARVGRLTKADARALQTLHHKSQQVRNDALNQAAFTSRLKSRDGLWQLDKDKYKKPQTNSCHCDDCTNAFSPYAYLINLLEMIYYHWELPVYDLERILLQEINDLDCETGQESLLQIELAIEILEKSSQVQIPLSDTTFNKKIEKIWAKLLFNDDTAQGISLLKSLEQSSVIRAKNLGGILLDSEKDLSNFKKGVKELKKPPKISVLNSISEPYAKGGEAFDTALEKAYQEIMRLYRELLIAKSGKTVEHLQKDFFIDLKAGACHKTNRITFLILSLQSFVLAARVGELSDFNRPDVEQLLRNKVKNLHTIPMEEASWKWLKNYNSWASAMYAFLYPENLAIPFFSEVAGNDFLEYTSSFLTTSMDRVKVFQNIYRYYFNEEARTTIRNIYPDLEEQYPLFLKETIEAGEGYFHAAKTPVEKFMYNLSFLLGTHVGYLAPFGKRNNYKLKNSLLFPLLAAYSLNKSEQYESAHDWYCLLYDPTKSGSERYGFDFDHHFQESVSYREGWNTGVVDPTGLAHRREGVMLRHVIIMMVKNLLDWADHEFALATASSLDRARQLYELAQEVLDAPDLSDECYRSIRQLTIEIVTSIGLDPGSVAGTIVGIIEDLYYIDDPEIIGKAIEDIRGVIPDDGTIDPSPIEKIVETALKKHHSQASPEKLSGQLAHRDAEIVKLEEQTLLETPFQEDGGISPYYFAYSGNGPFAGILTGINSNEGKVYTNPVALCVPPNPVLVALNAYIQLSLLKLQSCLDISGEPLPQIVISDESVAEFFDTVNAEAERTPLLDLPATWFNEPPRYRYSYLVEKARQYTEVAQRMGAALLVAYQNYDNEKFGILKAQHAIELASSTIDLRNLGLKEAVTGLELADLQLSRAETQLNFWQDRIEDGMLSEKEQLGLFLMTGSAWLSVAAGIVNGIGAITAFFAAGGAGAAGGAAAGSVVPGGGNAAGAGGGGAAGFSLGAAFAAAIPGTGAALGSFAGALSTFGSINLTMAGFERRFEDWNLQRDLSDFDVRIAETQIQAANNRIDIANQELSIANLQNTQAKEVLSFLENKFSNHHLYEWMIRVLSQNYRTLMQIASSVARQAQQVLEFERQETLTMVSGDYWSVSSVNAYTGNLSEAQKEAGLLGAERLLTDLTRLDAYKLSTEKRRLQLSKTISLAQMMPGEFAQLKTSGKITFNTLMHWFDRDFPGHYLRLIKSVKVSMLALTPPVDGIHAMLSNSGESTVVVKDGLEFKSIRSFRNFGETIALDSPFNETGLFIFNHEDPMLLPFEGLGVETQWVLELPKASNRFNFDTLVDVMFTIEYTAMHDEVYAQEIKAGFGEYETNDLPLNIRLQYPDEWYHFKNNPVADDNRRRLTVKLPKQLLPPHYAKDEAASTTHVTVMLMGNFADLSDAISNQLLESIQISHDYQHNTTTNTLKLTSQPNPPAGETPFVTKLIQPENGSYALFSTRDNNNPSYQLGGNTDPTEDWNISITDVGMPDGKTLGEVIEDILVVVTTKGKVIWI